MPPPERIEAGLDVAPFIVGSKAVLPMFWQGTEVEAARVYVVDPEPRPTDLSFPADSAFAGAGYIEVRHFVVPGKKWGELALESAYIAIIDNSVRPRVVRDAVDINSKRFKTLKDLASIKMDDPRTFLVHNDRLRPAREWDKEVRQRAARLRELKRVP